MSEEVPPMDPKIEESLEPCKHYEFHLIYRKNCTLFRRWRRRDLEKKYDAYFFICNGCQRIKATRLMGKQGPLGLDLESATVYIKNKEYKGETYESLAEAFESAEDEAPASDTAEESGIGIQSTP